MIECNKFKIFREFVDNPLRNYQYVIACKKTNKAAVIDPCDMGVINPILDSNNLSVELIINTHEHNDHICANRELKLQTNAKIYAPDFDIYKDKDVAIQDKGILTFGDNIKLTAIFLPGHTKTHMAYLITEDQEKFIFSGDVIFNAGIGHVHFGGDIDMQFETITQRLKQIPKHTKFFSGHDLFCNNLEFTLHYEPSNMVAQKILEEVRLQSPNNRNITTFEEERNFNLFLRLDSSEMIVNLIKKGYLSQCNNASEKEIFIALRKARDNW